MIPATQRFESFIGEIVEQRYAVVEFLGVDRYLAYDMRALRRTVIEIGGDGHVVPWVDRSSPPTSTFARASRVAPRAASCAVPRAVPRAAKPPPVPPQTRSRPLARRLRLDSKRIETAWFVLGEQLEKDQAIAEVTDVAECAARQAELERLAADLP